MCCYRGVHFCELSIEENARMRKTIGLERRDVQYNLRQRMAPRSQGIANAQEGTCFDVNPTRYITVDGGRRQASTDGELTVPWTLRHGGSPGKCPFCRSVQSSRTGNQRTYCMAVVYALPATYLTATTGTANQCQLSWESKIHLDASLVATSPWGGTCSASTAHAASRRRQVQPRHDCRVLRNQWNACRLPAPGKAKPCSRSLYVSFCHGSRRQPVKARRQSGVPGKPGLPSR